MSPLASSVYCQSCLSLVLAATALKLHKLAIFLLQVASSLCAPRRVGEMRLLKLGSMHNMMFGCCCAAANTIHAHMSCVLCHSQLLTWGNCVSLDGLQYHTQLSTQWAQTCIIRHHNSAQGVTGSSTSCHLACMSVAGAIDTANAKYCVEMSRHAS